MAITHAKISAKSDGGDSTLVRPSDWNAEHTDSNAVYAKATFGCVADGSTDDTAAFEAGLATVADLIGPTVYMEPGVYNFPNGIVSSIRGLRLIGLGHRTTGPGLQAISTSAVIKNTATGTWGLTLAPSTAGTNEYIGSHLSNIIFYGDADTAGGLLLQQSYCQIDYCAASTHAIGCKVMYDTSGAADSAQLNTLNGFYVDRCTTGIQNGESGMSGGVVTMMNNCCGIGLGATGTGILNYDNSSQISGGDWEGFNRGIYLRGGASSSGTSVIGVRFEGPNTIYDIDIDRASGSGSGTNNFVVVPGGTIHIGSNNVADFVYTGNGATVTDEGTASMIFGGTTRAGIQVWDNLTSGAPSGGHNGEICLKDGKLYYRTNGSWKALTGT